MSDAPTSPAGHEVGLHAGVLDRLGQEIVSGTLAVDSVVRIDQLDERFGVSRSVVREAVRVLSSMGLVETRRRLGVRVLPSAQWNVFDPRVIRWRLDGPDREDQLVSLGELRRGFEPVAAELAADRATPDQCSDELPVFDQTSALITSFPSGPSAAPVNVTPREYGSGVNIGSVSL